MRFSVLLATALLLPLKAEAASFDCSLARLSDNEKAICDNRDLNDADVRMATMLDFLTGLFAMGTRGNIMDDQAAWLKQRMACDADIACIRDAYDRRIKALQAIYDGIDRPL